MTFPRLSEFRLACDPIVAIFCTPTESGYAKPRRRQFAAGHIARCARYGADVRLAGGVWIAADVDCATHPCSCAPSRVHGACRESWGSHGGFCDHGLWVDHRTFEFTRREA